jgi:hypothetical protein
MLLVIGLCSFAPRPAHDLRRVDESQYEPNGAISLFASYGNTDEAQFHVL